VANPDSPVNPVRRQIAAAGSSSSRGRVARRRLRSVLLPVGSVVVVLAVWQYASGRWFDEEFISKPSAVWSAFLGLIRSGALANNLPVTLEEAAFGFLLGAGTAVPVAIVLARYKPLLDATSPMLIAFYCIPRLALGPLFIVWFGIGTAMKIWLTASIVFFPMYFTCFDGARDINQSLLHSARIMGGSRVQILRYVSLPSMLTWFFVGVRQALPFALTGAVVGELIVATSGMGFLLAQAAGSFETAELIAVLFVISAIGYIGNEVLNVIEKRVFRWKVNSGTRT
jgi:NitT/TauT family transport system permease protein